jgi:hypothetical protein
MLNTFCALAVKASMPTTMMKMDLYFMEYYFKSKQSKLSLKNLSIKIYE